MTEPTSRTRRIMIYGDFTWDRLASSYRRAFEQLGHAVVPFDANAAEAALPWWLRSRVGDRLCRRWPRARRHAGRRLNRELIDGVRTAGVDLVFVLNGDLVVPETIARLRERARVFIFHADDPFPGSVNHRPEHLPAARACDVYFMWGRALCGRLAQAGTRRVEYLPFAWDPDVFPHQGACGDADHEVVFVGGWDKEREAWLNEVATRFRLAVWGPSYWQTRSDRGSPVRRSWRGELRGRDAADVIARSRVTINLLRAQNLPDGTNMRTFEVPGVGGLLLSTRSRGAAEVFPEGEAGAYFDTPEQLCEQIEWLLAEGAARRRMADAAHEIVHASHQYRHRAARVLKVLDEIGPT